MFLLKHTVLPQFHEKCRILVDFQGCGFYPEEKEVFWMRWRGVPFGHTVWQYKNGRRICGLLLHAPDDDGEGDVTIEEHST